MVDLPSALQRNGINKRPGRNSRAKMNKPLALEMGHLQKTNDTRSWPSAAKIERRDCSSCPLSEKCTVHLGYCADDSWNNGVLCAK